MRNNLGRAANSTAAQEPFRSARTFKTTSEEKIKRAKPQTVTEACLQLSDGPLVLVYSQASI